MEKERTPVPTGFVLRLKVGGGGSLTGVTSSNKVF